MIQELLLFSAFLKRAEKKILFEKLSEIFDETSENFKFLKTYYLTYNEFPTEEVFEQETGYSLPEPAAPFEFYLQKCKDAQIHAQLLEVNNICSPYLQEGNYNPQLAAEKLLSHALKLQHLNKDSLLDVTQAKQILITQSQNLQHKKTNLYKTGYPKLDECINGISSGDLISIVGRLNMGKTFFMLSLANYIWNTYQVPILFVSLEMSAAQILQRLVALNTTININKIIQGALDKKDWKMYNEFFTKLEKKACPFVVYDKYALPLEQVYAKAQSCGSRVVFVDGAYMLRLQKFMMKTERYSQIAEELKGYSFALQAPIFASWQLNRESAKSKEVTASSIYYSDDIGQLSSVIFAVLLNSEIDKDYKRKIQILKARDGRLGEVIINWKISDGIDFSEVDNTLLKIGDYF